MVAQPDCRAISGAILAGKNLLTNTADVTPPQLHRDSGVSYFRLISGMNAPLELNIGANRTGSLPLSNRE
jgi:hypothetical protein